MPCVEIGLDGDDVPNLLGDSVEDGVEKKRESTEQMCTKSDNETGNNSDMESVGSPIEGLSDDEAAELTARLDDKDGRYYDNPLWYGKTLDDIRMGSEAARLQGNVASGDQDWKTANRLWKDALQGAEKLKDLDLQIRIRLNLALGYVKCEKAAKALEQCDSLFSADLFSAITPKQRAKAHYRRAEAHLAAHDESKAVSSFRSCITLDPCNADARNKLLGLRKQQVERKLRERDMFHRALHIPKGSGADDANVADVDQHADKASSPSKESLLDEPGKNGVEMPCDVSGRLTAKSRAADLARSLRELNSKGLGCNFHCPGPIAFLGPTETDSNGPDETSLLSEK